MDLLDNYKKNNILDTFTKPSIFLSQLDTIQMYDNIKNNIQELYTSLLTISTDIDKNVNQINTDYQELNKLIEILKERNIILKQKLGIAEDTYDGSDTMISNYKDMYNLQYLKNFSLGLGIVFSVVLITKLFKGQNIALKPTIS